MEGIVLHFRRGRRTQNTHQVIAEFKGISSREKAASLINKKAVWKSPAGKELAGIVSGVHGNIGKVRIQFECGVPGQAIGTKIKVD